MPGNGGDINTVIHYLKMYAHEMYDLVADPNEQHNLLFSSQEALKPEVVTKFAELKAELASLQKEYRDKGQYADSETWPQCGVDGPIDDERPLGFKSISSSGTGRRRAFVQSGEKC